jgi:hypothetical protein
MRSTFDFDATLAIELGGSVIFSTRSPRLRVISYVSRVSAGRTAWRAMRTTRPVFYRRREVSRLWSRRAGERPIRRTISGVKISGASVLALVSTGPGATNYAFTATGTATVVG